MTIESCFFTFHTGLQIYSVKSSANNSKNSNMMIMYCKNLSRIKCILQQILTFALSISEGPLFVSSLKVKELAMQKLHPPPSCSRRTRPLSYCSRIGRKTHVLRGRKTRSIPGCSGSYSYSIVLAPHLPPRFGAPTNLSSCSSLCSPMRMTHVVTTMNGPWMNCVVNDWLSSSYASWPVAYDDW